MKTKFLYLLIFTLGFTTSCNHDEDLPKIAELDGVWDLVNISGGFAGVNCDYPAGEITWIFENDLLVVENNYTGDPTQICGGVLSSSSSDSYFVLESNGSLFLVLNNKEAGGITLSDNELIIDTNVSSVGSGADGFIYRLER
ncbi:MAG: hypothetical protein ACI8P3_001607 [Saprospiraceae bacterium]|jgi:hypothetical protein